MRGAGGSVGDDVEMLIIREVLEDMQMVTGYVLDGVSECCNGKNGDANKRGRPGGDVNGGALMVTVLGQIIKKLRKRKE